MDLQWAPAAKAYLFALLPDARRVVDRAIDMVISACGDERALQHGSKLASATSRRDGPADRLPQARTPGDAEG